MAITLTLLGGFELRDASGRSHPLRTRKTRALLAYLAAHQGRPVARDRLMTLLWGEFSTSKARHNLNQTLVAIRKVATAQGTALLESSADAVLLRDDPLESDLSAFRQCPSGRPDDAIEVYGGAFLDGMYTGSADFDDWAALVREDLHEQYCDALERAARAATEHGDRNRALALARKLVQAAPLRESGHIQIMKSLLDAGDRTGAWRQYEACAKVLREELGISPGPDCQAVAERIRGSAGALAPNVDASKKPLRHTRRGRTTRARPRIAVLPADDLGSTPEVSRLGRQLSAGLLDRFAGLRWFEVIAPAHDPERSAKDLDRYRASDTLGVQYLLESSVSHAARRVRVTVRLFDATRGVHLWSDRFECESSSGFELDDTLAGAVAARVEPIILANEIAKCRFADSLCHDPDSDAWQLYLEGMRALLRPDDSFVDARASLIAAVELEPDFAQAWAALSHVHGRTWLDRVEPVDGDVRDLALDQASRAVSIDPHNPYAHYAQGRAHTSFESWALGRDSLNTTLRLSPNSVYGLEGMAKLLTGLGRAGDSLGLLQRALEVAPYHPKRRMIFFEMGRALLQQQRFRQALSPLDRSASIAGHWAVDLWRAMALNGLGRKDEARKALRSARRRRPELSPARLAERYESRRRIPAVRAWLTSVNGLRSVGFVD